MGRFKIKGVLVFLLTLQNVVMPNYGLAANDGLNQQMPRIIPDNNIVPSYDSNNKNQGNNSGNRNNNSNYNNNNNDYDIFNPKRPLVTPDNSIRGFRIDNATIQIADVSEEFACPLFEGKAYESVMSSLDKLSESMRSTIKCNPSQTMGNVVDNTQKIRDAITVLEPYFKKPEDAYENIDAIESSISRAVGGLDGLTQSLSSSSFQATDCGKNIAANPTFASSLSSLVTSLGPFALLGISMVPGLALPVKAASLAIIAGASSYNEYQKLTYGRSVDMSDHEQWKAVVQNTCAYSRIVRKMNYIQRFESGLLPNMPPSQQKDLSNLPTDIQTKVLAFNLRYKNNQRLIPLIETSKADKIRFDEMSEVLQMGSLELSRMASQIGGDAKANPEIACSVGLELARLAKNNTGFPGEIIKSIDLLNEFHAQGLERNYSGLVNTYERLVDGLLLLKNDSLTSQTAVNDCALKTASLISVLNRTISIYRSMAAGVAKDQENILLKNPEYRRWKDEFQNVESQKLMGQQLFSVMKNVSGSSAILRSYLNRRQNELRSVLFGAANWWNIDPAKYPPVYKWLDFTLDMHNASVKELSKNFEVIKKDLYSLNARLLKYDPNSKDSITLINQKLMLALRRASNFEGLDAKNFNMREQVSIREKQMVCRRLLNTWDTWIQATNHLDSVGVFCDMIDPLIDVMTDKGIVKYCRGTNLDIKMKANPNNFAPPQESYVSLAAKNLLTPLTSLQGKSIEQVALMLPAKIKAMNCDISGGY